MRYPNVTYIGSNTFCKLHPSCVYAPDGGVPWDDLRKILHEGQMIAMVHNGSTLRVGRTNVTDDRRRTNGFAIAKTRT